MNAKIGCVGDLLVEIMRPGVDEPLGEPGTFVGPFASGASGIFIDAVGRLGMDAYFIGSVGDDEFGRLMLRRFEADGIDTSHIRVLKEYTTGVAFVTYFSDGSRQFIYHLGRAATGQIFPGDIDADYAGQWDYVHLVGSTMLINENCRQACQKAVSTVKAGGGQVSFDPNFRPELLSQDAIRRYMSPILPQADVVFPTEEEIEVLTGSRDVNEGSRALLEMGPRIVAVKQGKRGCSVFTRDEELSVRAFKVTEVDPTGAGDCYCAGFLAGVTQGWSLDATARFANAVAALAVTKKGPMEGAPFPADVETLMSSQP